MVHINFLQLSRGPITVFLFWTRSRLDSNCIGLLCLLCLEHFPPPLFSPYGTDSWKSSSTWSILVNVAHAREKKMFVELYVYLLKSFRFCFLYF